MEIHSDVHMIIGHTSVLQNPRGQIRAIFFRFWGHSGSGGWLLMRWDSQVGLQPEDGVTLDSKQ